MAKVYRARHAVLDTIHALKVLDDKYRANPEARRRFLDEAKIQAKHLHHPGIVKVINIVSTAEAAALVMDLVDGGSLEDYINDRRQKPFSGDELLAFAVPILDAMAHAHDAGIIHRDIKPANILLAKKGDRLHPVITDFGIAKVTDSAATSKKKSTHADARMGTLGYMSPEQIRKAKDVTQRADIFSLGAMFYEMATGKAPFEGDSDFDIMEKIVHGRFEPMEKHASADVPPHMIAAIKRAMEADQEKRFADCREFSAALAGGKPVSATAGVAPTPVTARKTMSSEGKGGPRYGLFAGLAIVAIGAGGAAIYVATRTAPAPGGSGSAGSSAGLVAGDAGTLDAERVAMAPVDAGADPWTVDARAAIVVDADETELPLMPPPIDAYKPPPPPPPSCKGRWGGELTLAIRGGSACGSISFKHGSGTCVGSLTGCSDGRRFSARYNCSMAGSDYAGSLEMSCTGGSTTVSLAFGGAATANRMYMSKSVRRN